MFTLSWLSNISYLLLSSFRRKKKPTLLGAGLQHLEKRIFVSPQFRKRQRVCFWKHLKTSSLECFRPKLSPQNKQTQSLESIMQYFVSLSLLVTNQIHSNIVARFQNFIQKLLQESQATAWTHKHMKKKELRLFWKKKKKEIPQSWHYLTFKCLTVQV